MENWQKPFGRANPVAFFNSDFQSAQSNFCAKSNTWWNSIHGVGVTTAILVSDVSGHINDVLPLCRITATSVSIEVKEEEEEDEQITKFHVIELEANSPVAIILSK